MNYLSTLVAKRRSIRQYAPDKSISQSDVKQIMKVALMAPTSKNSQTCHFILVENKLTLQMLSSCKPSGSYFLSNCALAIVVVSNSNQSEASIEDATIAATYIQLKAEDLNLGSCWVHIRDRKTENGANSDQYIRGILNIPNSFDVECIISIGQKVKDSKPHNEEDLVWEKLHKEIW